MIVPVPEVTLSNNGPICAGDAAVVSASAVSGAIYRWYDGSDPSTANLLSTDQNYSIANLAAGTYSYYLQVEQNTCFSSVESTTITVEDNPSVGLSYTYIPNTDCAGADLSLMSDVTASASVVVGYEWSGPNGFSSTEANPVINFANTQNNGSYTCLLYTSPSPRDRQKSRMPSSA